MITANSLPGLQRTTATETWWELQFWDQTQGKDETDPATRGVYHIPALSKCSHTITKGRGKIQGFSRQPFLLIAKVGCPESLKVGPPSSEQSL